MNLKKPVPEISIPFLASALFLISGIICLFISYHDSIRDFGNYYYGSKLLLDSKFTGEMYTDIHYFNRQIADYGETNFFENYIPVPPFSAIFYLPFTVFKSMQAKLIFNLLSLLLFCFSFRKLLIFLKIETWMALMIPLAFLFPLYNNIAQGQCYLLIGALLIEIFISTEKQKVIYPSALLALIVLLKIFPVFLLAYFILKKNYKVVFYTLGWMVLFQCLCFICIDAHLIGYYFTDIIPRLFNNDVIGTYYYGNQSIYTFLLNVFSYDALNNPDPLVNCPAVVAIIESICPVYILLVLWEFRTRNSFLVFAFVLFGMSLLGKYNTTYSMLFLMPLGVALVKERKLWYFILLTFCLTILLKLPPGDFGSISVFLKFARLGGLLLLLVVCVHHYRIKLNYKVFAMVLVPLMVFRYVTFPIKPVNYFFAQNTIGALYDVSVKDHMLTLKSTIGERDFEETVEVPGKIISDTHLIVRNNKIWYKNKLQCDTKDNKLKAFIYNDTSIVFMSDLNQAVRFYKLRTISLHE